MQSVAVRPRLRFGLRCTRSTPDSKLDAALGLAAVRRAVLRSCEFLSDETEVLECFRSCETSSLRRFRIESIQMLARLAD